IVNRDNREDKLCLKLSVSISSDECKHIKIEDNDDVKFFIKYICEVIPSKVAPLLVSIEDRGVTNVVGDRIHITTDMSRIACSSNTIVESNGNVHGDFGTEYLDMIDFTMVEGMHSGDNGTEMNGLQMHSAPPILAHLETFSQVGVVGFGTTSELSIQHNWRQMGEQNVHNLGIVNDEEEDIESAYSRNNWDPKLEVGKIFSSKEALSNKLQLAAMRGHFEFKVKQSCKSRLVVVCSQGPCPWRLRASSYGEKNFMIVKYNPVHECDMSFIHDKHRHASAKLVGNAVKRKLKDSRTIYTPSDIIRDVKQNFGVTINYCKAWRSRELALMSTRGSVEEAYSLLPAYCHELEHVNSSTRTYIHTDENNHFLYFFMAVGACIRGFQSSMRPVIAVDATHLKCKYKGVLFVANAFDGNRNIYPLAFGIGDLEKDASWHWFFSKLHEVIGECPNLKKLRRRLECASRMNVVKLNYVEYNVVDGDMDGHVHLTNNTCSCRKFQLEQLPCKHVVAVCRFLKLNIYSMASRYYTRNTWLDAYSDTIYLVQPQELWVIPEDVQSRVVRPPNAKVMPGRRKKLRIPSQGEDIIRRKCSRCSGTSHNKSNCKNNVPLLNVGHTL
ncbi:unnamed protein product, partial [Prunus brigantina]